MTRPAPMKMFGFCAPPELRARVEDFIKRRRPGSISSTVRLALERGLDILEKEFPKR